MNDGQTTKMIFSALGGIRGCAKLAFTAMALGLFTLTVPAQTASPFNLPLYFEANKDQTQFVSHGNGYEFLISATGAQIALHGAAAGSAAVQMQFPGANARAEIRGDGELPGKINYLIGNDPAKWQTGLPTFSRVQIAGIYPGIDLVFHGNQGRLEYDFTITPGAKPNAIKIRFDGVDKISLTPQGGLILKIGSGEVQQSGPEIYQIIGGGRKMVAGGYKLLDSRTVAFEVGDYDHSQPLVIDPVLSYSAYFGGTASTEGFAIALNTNSIPGAPNGTIYIAGQTLSQQFSTSGAYQTNFQGGLYNGDAFVARFSNPATNLIYLTYLGGNSDDAAFGLAVDPTGNAFIAGYTDSTNFPTTNAIYPKLTTAFSVEFGAYLGDAFVAELNTNGSSLIYSTYLGGTNPAISCADAVAIDSSDNAYVVGFTYSTNFPVTGNALQKKFGPPFYTVGINANAFVSEIPAYGTGTNLIYSTYLGGTNLDIASSVCVDPNNNVYVAGYTASFNFPVWNMPANLPNGGDLNGTTNLYADQNPNNTYDAFVTKFPPLNSTITASQITTATNSYSTLLGSTNEDQAFGIACDSSGNAYVTGFTTSTNFPNTITPTNMFSFLVTNGLYAPFGVTNAFLTKLSASGSVVYSTVFGGQGGDIASGVAVDSAGDAFVVGYETSTNFPVVNTFGQLSATNSGEITLNINNVFVTGFNSNCSSVYYSVLLGGNESIYGYQGSYGYGIAVDASTNAYITGQTADTNFPTANAPVFSLAGTNTDNGLFLNGTNDAFVAEILFAPTAPAILAGPTNQTVGVGATVSFTLIATNATALLYQWQFTNAIGPNAIVFTNLVNGGNISGVCSNVLTITNVTTNNAGTYSVVVSYGGGAITSNATLTVILSPLIVTPLTNQTVGLGATVTFPITAFGQPPLSYSWQFNGLSLTNGSLIIGATTNQISGATTNTLTLTGTTVTNSGTYEVTVTNAFGATNSSAMLTVLAAPEFVNFSAISNNVNNGLNINIIGGTNSGHYSFLWTTNLQTPIADWNNDGYLGVSTQGAVSFPLATNFFNPYSPQAFFLLESTNVP